MEKEAKAAKEERAARAEKEAKVANGERQDSQPQPATSAAKKDTSEQNVARSQNGRRKWMKTERRRVCLHSYLTPAQSLQ